MSKVLFYCTNDDVPYLGHLKSIVGGKLPVVVNNSNPVALTEAIITAKERGCDKIATTNPNLLKLVVDKKFALIDDYQGSMVERNGIEILILPPVEHIVTIPYGKFLYQRYFDKFLAPDSYFKIPEFKWELFDPKNADDIEAFCASADFIAQDIETRKDDTRTIICEGFCAVRIDTETNSFTYRCFLVPFTDIFNITFVRRISALKTAKAFQNGKYDNAYHLRYGIPVTNYALDTINLFHCWLSELPKDLGFITAFMLRKWEYWKDESGENLYQYCAKDAFATAMSILALMAELPPYALENYNQEFPIVFPCILAEMTGLKYDPVVMGLEKERFEKSLEIQLEKLQTMVGNDNFNPSSSQQTVRLFKLLGSGDIEKTTPPFRDKVSFRHPINKRILKAIESYRKDRKLVTSYLTDWDKKNDRPRTWHGRIYFVLNPHGTDTGRLASKESQFWCGLQLHNIPRDRKDIQVKRGFIADPGFYFGEVDYEQNEARGTGYLSGDTNLIKAVDDPSRDFHGHNAASFFGVAYEKIVLSRYDEQFMQWVHDTVDKELRDLSKRTNHGSNYNMGAGVLLDTMGIENVLRAKKLLGLPAHFTLLDTTSYLLEMYEKTYPVVKKQWYEKCINDVESTGFLVGPTGWHRRCFGSPRKNKRDLNRYVAHPPQSLAAMQLNKAYNKVLYNVALKNVGDFKLGPQIHDSIFFQYRIGRQDIAFAVKENAIISIQVKDSFGIERTLRVPASLKGESTRWSDVKPMLQKAA